VARACTSMRYLNRVSGEILSGMQPTTPANYTTLPPTCLPRCANATLLSPSQLLYLGGNSCREVFVPRVFSSATNRVRRPYQPLSFGMPTLGSDGHHNPGCKRLICATHPIDRIVRLLKSNLSGTIAPARVFCKCYYSVAHRCCAVDAMVVGAIV
jgi:hypothetical protein